MFKDKIVWITGASSGIGEELAKQFNAAGAFVVLSARRAEKLEEVRSSLQFPDKSMVVPMDLEKPDEFEKLTKEVVDSCKRIDILINNGGLSQRGEAGETSLEIDRKIMEINFFGSIALTKAVLPVMRRQNSGHIVALSSIAGKFGFFLRSAYSASKHALQGFYESLLLEEAKNNIHVTIAFPGKINTNISVSALNSSGDSHGEMDHNQATGMPADVCAKKLIRAIGKKKKSILIGNKEILAVYIKRYWPWLFWRIISKQKAT